MWCGDDYVIRGVDRPEGDKKCQVWFQINDVRQIITFPFGFTGSVEEFVGGYFGGYVGYKCFGDNLRLDI